MDSERIGLGASLAAAALALGLGTAAGRAIALRSPAPQAAALANQPGQPPQPQQPAAATAAGATPTAAAPTTSTGPKRWMVPVSTTQPKTGANEALVTLVEWCDLPDAACAALEPRIRAVLDQHPDSVRLVFRHYDHPLRPGSRIAHNFVRAAFEQAGKFWEARALLLKHTGDFTLDDAERYTKQLGMDWKAVREAINTDAFASSITSDRIFASMFEVTEPPALFVNGRSLGNNPSALELTQMVVDELQNGGELLAQGVEKAQVYAELTKKGAWNKPDLPRQ